MQTMNYSDRLKIAANQNVKEKNYWIKKLSGELLKSHFPYDFHKNQQKGEKIQQLKFLVTGDEFSKLIHISDHSSFRLYMILVAALTALLGKYTGHTDIIIGTPIYKQDIETDFINTVLALRNRLEDNTTFKDLLLQVRQTVVDATEHYSYPIEVLADQLNISSTDSDFPLFDVMVLLENIHEKNYISHINTNMIVSFIQNSHSLEGSIEYNSLRYQKETVERIIRHFKQLLTLVLFNLDLPISAVDIYSDKEKKQLLVDFNETTSTYPQDKTIPYLFEFQAKKIPHRIALVFKPMHLTYRELNKKANQLAHLLREKGAAPGSIVGISEERSIDMMIWILGILKAGAAYLPLDPDAPQKRIISILDDSRASLLLTKTAFVAKHSFAALQNLPLSQAKLHMTPRRPQITDFDGLPLPDRSFIDYDRYNRFLGQAMVTHSIALQATRGCPYNCAYCHKIWPRNHVARSAENIMEEVLMYYCLGVKRFVILDDIFNFNKQNSTKFFESVIKNRLDIQIFFPNGIRGDLLTPDYIDLMIEAGTVGMALALETASPRLQKLIRKNLKIEKLKENIEYITSKHPQFSLELFTIIGFPTETEEEAMMTLDFIKSIKWLHFPFLSILKIYPNTDMVSIATKNGISLKTIYEGEHLAFHEVPDTLPFDRKFVLQFQSDFLNRYFLLKERLLQVLPYQMKILTEEEIVLKYDSYLPYSIKSFDELLNVTGIAKNELKAEACVEKARIAVPNLTEKIRKIFPPKKPGKNALKILLLDLSQAFTTNTHQLNNLIEPPLGLLNLATCLDQEFGSRVSIKISKSRIDFDSYEELKQLIKQFNPHLIGIRSFTFYKSFFHHTLALIRQWDINVPIIGGGPYASSDYLTILQDRNIDLIVLGEGEVTFNILIGKILENDKKLPGEDILKEIAGIVFVPKTPAHPQTYAREILLMDDAAALLDKQSTENLEPVNRSTDLAYAVFTSGSTGKPKGILTTHHNVLRVVKNTNYIDLSPHDRILQLSNYTFDGSVFDIYGALLNGSTLVLVNEYDVLSMDKLAGLIINEKINVFFITTALFNVMIDLDKECLDNVRKILFGGERVSVNHCQKALEYLGKEKILHVYGPTETTVFATYFPINRINENNSTIPIGSPISNTTAYILGKNLKPVPIGAAGELYIGGQGVARGYLNNSELTQEKFIRNPFLKGDRLYRSGDIVRFRGDMNIEFLDRSDHQVKMRGFRIELGEIEYQLLNHKKIKKAVVLAYESKSRNQRYLCAYVVPNFQQDLDTTQVRTYLAKELPDYMIPAYIIEMENIPLTANGKIDKKALPEPEAELKDYVAPQDECENRLVEIWEEVLGVKNIGITTNLFEVGGDSIKAIQILARMKKNNLKVDSKDLFLHPTIKELVKFVKKTDHVIPQETVTGNIEPTPALKWFFENEFPRNHHFNQSLMIFRQEGFDETILEKVFKKIITHHDALRMVYETKNGNIRLTNKGIEGKLFDLDVIHLETETGIENKIKTGANRIQRGIDLKNGPLVKLGLFKTNRGDHLLIVIHHLVIDGISWRIILEDFSTAYPVVEKGREITLQNKTDSFKTWAQRLNEYASSHEVLKELEYWQSLEAIPVEKLPKKHDISKEMKKLKYNDTLWMNLDKKETQKLLKETNFAYNTEINDILLTALGLSLKEWKGLEKVFIGLEGHGRESIIEGIDISRTVGWFTSFFPVVLDMQNTNDLSHLIKLVKESIRRIPNKGIGCGILKYLTPWHQRKGIELNVQAEIGFNYLGQFGQENQGENFFTISPMNMGEAISPEMERRCPIDINGFVVEDSLHLSFYYCKNEFEKNDMEKLVNLYKSNLLNIIEYCSQKKEKELTPSDVGYNEISIAELQQIEKHIAENI